MRLRDLAERWVDFVEYCIHRDYLFRQRTKIRLEPAPDDARFLTTVRLWLAAMVLLVLIDGLLGSHLQRRGFASSLGLVLAPFLVVILVNRTLGVDEHRAVARSGDASRGRRNVAYRCLSLFVLLPAAIGSGLLARELRGMNQARELAPVYALLHRDDRDAAWSRLEPTIQGKYLEPEQVALAALILLRDGESGDKAKEYVEAAVVRANTRFSKACGTHVSRIARGSCEAYVAEVEIHDPALAKELSTRYCAAFKHEFPQPEPEASGCGTPAPTVW